MKYKEGKNMNASNIDQLEVSINKLGDKLLNCTNDCDGIINKKPLGIIPRCLYLEKREEYEKGCVVVGINPGKSKENERGNYKKINLTYDDVKIVSKNIIDSHKYYNQIRKFLEIIDRNGPILWTELVKCENEENNLPDLQTFRICTKKYLTEEIKKVPENWPLIAVGKMVYYALSFLYPDKAVIGIPHPTGSYGYFNKLIDQENVERVSEDAHSTISNNRAIWLTHKKEK